MIYNRVKNRCQMNLRQKIILLTIELMKNKTITLMGII